MAVPQSIYQATLAGRREVYNAYLAAGKGTPFLYPWDTLPVLYLFLGIILKPRLPQSQKKVFSYVAFAAVVLHSVYIGLNRRTLGFAGGYGIGLTFGWGTVISAAFLLLHDVENDFVRLEVREAGRATTYIQTPRGVTHSIDSNNGTADVKQRLTKGSTAFSPSKLPKDVKDEPKYALIWQTFPKEVGHSIDWTIDLMTSFRGPNWNFRIPTLPKIKTLPPPPQFKTARAIEATMLANETETASDAEAAAFQRKAVKETVILYLFLDVIKSTIITDPYFLGLRPLDYPTPWPVLHDHAFATKFVRLIIAMISVITALSFVFSLEPLFFYVVLPAIMPQSTLQKITKSPLYDTRMYGSQFTSLKTIATSGLGGFWGKLWHQMFRYGVSEPSRPLVKALNLDPRSQLARAVQLLVAFCISGCLHAAAASTTFSIIPARPWQPWLFFMSQAVGIILQTWLVQVVKKQLKLKPPAWLDQIANSAFVLVWLWYTGPWLSDDFARAGVWLFEPIPISFVRGLTGQGWYQWGEKWAGIWRGDSMFSSGIAAF